MITELETRRRAAQRQIEQLTAPQKAIAAAEQELATLEAQIEQARQQAARDATMAQLLEQARRGSQALAAIREAQAQFDAVVLPALEAYSAAKQRQGAARSAFYAALREISPEAGKIIADQTASLAILMELEESGADLAGVLANFGDMRMPFDRPTDTAHQFPGALASARREAFVHAGGHLSPDSIPQVDHRTAAQLLSGK